MGQVIPGWDEAFTTVKEGTNAVLFIPANLAYGEQGNSVIPPNSDLIFYVELNGVN
ncbi:MAG: FKBP-type peptidyl-prolyl cis-trans isomerase [Saprospirales bacterium]|nr:FKBP-type peptidyl-prolyl cis-trans isomerase [Saprospirales bacterium]